MCALRSDRVTVPADLLKDDVAYSDLTAAGINRIDARLMITKARHRAEGARLENTGARLQAGRRRANHPNVRVGS